MYESVNWIAICEDNDSVQMKSHEIQECYGEEPSPDISYNR